MGLQGVDLTFRVLATTRNPAALPVLIAALDSPWAKIRRLAVEALLTRRDPEGHRAILERLAHWPKDLRQLVWRERARLGATLRDFVLSPDFEQSLRGLQAAVWLRDYDLAPILVNMLLCPSSSAGAVAADAVLQLAQALAEELEKAPPTGIPPALQTAKAQFLRSLSRAIEHYDLHQRTEVLVAALILADPLDPLWRRVLDDPGHKAHKALAELLLKSSRPEVLRLILRQLEQADAPSVVLRAVAKRRDLTFVGALLSLLSENGSAELARNLGRLRGFSWLEDLEEFIPKLDAKQQLGLVRLTQVSGIRRLQAQEVLRQIVRLGLPAARTAAVNALADFTGPQANVIICQALQDPEPEVKAAAARQLRSRGIVGAIPRLIDLLESPEPVVQEAARESLQEFRFDRFLAAFDLVDEGVRHTTGWLVRKVDPTAVDRLRQELASPIRARRLRAIAMAEALHALTDVEQELIALTKDVDHLVRAAAVKALASVSSTEAHQAILEALNDSAAAVQHAARTALEHGSVQPPPYPVGSSLLSIAEMPG
ncbi:MAG: HEAT repeat domain-containing protein [Thermoguttaceae bacterium]|nr:HEAT repeat domain-containing protein [Thermoguttaceae bacterium]MDW8078931.1 HEAT repeat domain-containing protein [Thermoguttaceae bacterium]